MNSEYTAHASLTAQAEERARWVAALARPVNHPVRRTVRRSLIARLLGL